MYLQDSPMGVRAADYVTAFPAGINAAATYVALTPASIQYKLICFMQLEPPSHASPRRLHGS